GLFRFRPTPSFTGAPPRDCVGGGRPASRAPFHSSRLAYVPIPWPREPLPASQYLSYHLNRHESNCTGRESTGVCHHAREAKAVSNAWPPGARNDIHFLTSWTVHALDTAKHVEHENARRHVHGLCLGPAAAVDEEHPASLDDRCTSQSHRHRFLRPRRHSLQFQIRLGACL